MSFLFLITYFTSIVFIVNPTVEIKDLEPCSCNIMYIVYDSEQTFMLESKAVMHDKLKTDNNTNLKIPLLLKKEGNFAILVFQDVNNNGVLDKNILGIPTEPIGFSRNFRPKFRKPRFNDCSLSIDRNTSEISISMYRF